MKCPYCDDSSHVVEIGIPTVALLMAHAPFLRSGFLNAAAATALSATYRIIGKRKYKCTRCNNCFVA